MFKRQNTPFFATKTNNPARLRVRECSKAKQMRHKKRQKNLTGKMQGF
jgi:hypothetical protein